MRRRTKPKVVWLPTTNTFSVDTGNRSTWSLASVSAPAVAGGPAGVLEVPIVMDGVASDPLGATTSLADIESSGYRLRRIVGKLYCFLGQSQTTQVEDIYGVTAGFIIRRSDPSTGGSIEAATGGTTGLDPADIGNSMDPWIWRRSWILSNGPDGGGGAGLLTNQFASQLSGAGGHFNFGNGYPGGIAEGPHVDQKTARIVGPEERLFLDVSITPLLSVNQTTSLVCIYDLRCLASMRQNIGNRRNASR